MAATVGVFVHRGGEGARALQARLQDIAHKTRDLPKLQVERDARYSAIPWLDGLLRRVNMGQRLEMLLYQAGLSMRVGALLLLIVSFGIGGYFLAVVIFHRT